MESEFDKASDSKKEGILPCKDQTVIGDVDELAKLRAESQKRFQEILAENRERFMQRLLKEQEYFDYRIRESESKRTVEWVDFDQMIAEGRETGNVCSVDFDRIINEGRRVRQQYGVFFNWMNNGNRESFETMNKCNRESFQQFLDEVCNDDDLRRRVISTVVNACEDVKLVRHKLTYLEGEDAIDGLVVGKYRGEEVVFLIGVSHDLRRNVELKLNSFCGVWEDDVEEVYDEQNSMCIDHETDFYPYRRANLKTIFVIGGLKMSEKTRKEIKELCAEEGYEWISVLPNHHGVFEIQSE